MEYAKFDIVAVADLCGIELNSRTLDHVEVEAWCPFCTTQSSDFHLYLNKTKERYYCQKCSASGNSVSLYARIHSVSNKEAAGRLLEMGLDTGGYIPRFRNQAQNKKPDTPGYEVAPLGRRHDVYYDMLSLMSLGSRHSCDLQERGLSKERIRANMYRSMPEDFYTRRGIAEELATRHDLRGIPGFYYSKYRHWELWGKPGILIPVCNVDGYIQGLQIRLDNTSKKKYRWLSSNPIYNLPYGTAPSVWVHVTGNRDSEECELTEGALKGDTASYLSGDRLFVCTAGATSIQYLADTLRQLGVKKVNGCYDMDKVTEYYDILERRNADPLDGEAAKPCPLERMESAVRSVGIAYERRVWAPKLNGIDNYYLDWYSSRQKAG